MSASPEKVWMWPTPAGGVNGASIDPDTQKIIWYEDAAACACGETSAVQDFTGFNERGPVLSPPADVLDEMHTSIAFYSET